MHSGAIYQFSVLKTVSVVVSMVVSYPLKNGRLTTMPCQPIRGCVPDLSANHSPPPNHNITMAEGSVGYDCQLSAMQS